MTKQVTEGNKLIADFHDPEWRDGVIYETIEDPSYSQIIGDREVMRSVNESDLRYHESWDWLMPVVGKIETLGYDVKIDRGTFADEIGVKKHFCQVQEHGQIILTKKSTASKIDAVWTAVVEFIKWYSTEK